MLLCSQVTRNWFWYFFKNENTYYPMCNVLDVSKQNKKVIWKSNFIFLAIIKCECSLYVSINAFFSTGVRHCTFHLSGYQNNLWKASMKKRQFHNRMQKWSLFIIKVIFLTSFSGILAFLREIISVIIRTLFHNSWSTSEVIVLYD